MTRDKGYPDWLVLSARLLVQPSCGQVKIVMAKLALDHVPLWLCEDITACCYMYCYFRNKVCMSAIHCGCILYICILVRRCTDCGNTFP